MSQAFHPELDPYYEHQSYEDEPPSPPDSPRPESPPTPTPTVKKMRKLLRIRKALRSRTGSEIREEILQRCGSFTIPVRDHLNYKQTKNSRN